MDDGYWPRHFSGLPNEIKNASLLIPPEQVGRSPHACLAGAILARCPSIVGFGAYNCREGVATPATVPLPGHASGNRSRRVRLPPWP